MIDTPHNSSLETRRALLTGLGGLAAGALMASSTAHAGPLDPPAGPVAPTPGPEPRIAINATNTPGDGASLYRITQAGSYYLTGNIAGVAGKNGIVIAANGVTLDLNGFELVGGSGSLDGVTSLGGLLRTCRVVNGTVRSWGGNGVAFVSGQEHHVRDVHARANLGAGITCGAASVIESCTAANNTSDGIACLTNSVVRQCTAFFNGGNGISAGAGGLVSECTGIGNTLYGISVTQSIVATCTTTGNARSGVYGDYATTVTGCSSSGNDWSGFELLGHSSIVDCTAYNNAQNGISAKFGILIQRCTANANQNIGIHVFDSGGTFSEAGLVADCVVRGNAAHGIAVKGGVTVRGNQCARNSEGVSGGGGIYVFGDSNRIIDNHCNLNGTGVRVVGSGNLIQRNYCRDNNVNWDIAAPNAHVVVRASTGIPTFGNAGGGTLGSTDPSVNFTIT